MKITKKEILVQIALGTAEKPQQIARLVRNTDDIEALEWAIKYKNTKVRSAAICNPNLPIGIFLWAYINETSKTAQNVLRIIKQERQNEIDQVLFLIKTYPQLSLDLK